MLKFKFNYLQNSLAYQAPFEETWYPIDEEQKFEGNFGSQGFRLEQGWITFTIYSNRIRVFYKQIPSLGNEDFWDPLPLPFYYRKDLPKQEEVIFTFTPADEIEKVGSSWVKKNQVLSETKGGSRG